MAGELKRFTDALADRYAIERELSGGGMSRVFTARETRLNRQVVIKVLSADVAAGVSVERFDREIQLAASLQQANIVPLLSAGDVDGLPFYTMPFVAGESLRGRLSQAPRLTIVECIGILRDVARALSYAHARGVVHRDIKPDNVLLSHGAAMVTDFGIAKAVSASRTLGDNATLTQVGTLIGTPAYMAPEQVAGEPNVDRWADLYAWGCLAYEMLAGEPPFVRESAQRVLAAHLSESPTPIDTRRADVPPSLGRLVMRCLAKAPADRPANADEILHDLEGGYAPGGPPSKRPTLTPARALTSRRGLLAVAGLAVLAAAATILMRGRSPRGTTAVTAIDRSIAVLPLTNLSSDKTDDFFGIGLAEEMTRALAKTGVRVIGRVSAGALLAKGLDERAIAKELGVGSLLTGTVQRADGQVRINVTLSAADGAVRWTERYDRPMSNVFAVQEEIARRVAGDLLGSLGATTGGTSARVETADAEAHTLFLQGLVLWNRRTAPSIRQAIALFEQSVARDPKYARAHAWLAMAYVTLPYYVDSDTDSLLTRSIAAADRAIAIDSTISEAFTASAFVHAVRSQHREADRLFQHALALDSTLATTWFWHGLLAMFVGDFAGAQRRMERAHELEPASLIVRTGAAQVFLSERRFAAADAATSRTIALDSTFALAWSARSDALLGLNRLDEAIGILERRVVGLPGARPFEQQGALAYAYARGGRTQQARFVIERMRSGNGGRLPPVGILAAALERLGDREGAVTLLADAIARHDPWMLQFSHAERYDRLRQDPRAAGLLASIEAR